MSTRDQLRARLAIPHDRLDSLNAVLLDPDTRIVNDLLDVVARYGTPEEINAQAEAARQVPSLLARLRAEGSPYVADLEWLAGQRDAAAFVSVPEYRRLVLGEGAGNMTFQDDFAVTLEISAAQYFPWIIAEARQCIAERELMPGRFIRVRQMKESEADCGDLLAISAAMQIMGSSYVETLDTKGTDGSNIHLNGPSTITGYFGGVGQPNDHALHSRIKSNWSRQLSTTISSFMRLASSSVMACTRWNSAMADRMARSALSRDCSANSKGSSSGAESRRSASTASASLGAFSGSRAMTSPP